MQIHRDFINLPDAARGAVVALGNFDGLHLGHRAVLEAARQMAAQLSAPLAVMTFDPHPRRLFNPSLPVLRIVSLAERMQLLREAGVEHVFLQHFTRAFAATPARNFIEEILIGQLGVCGVVTGDNFCFGHQRGGNQAMLAQYAGQGSFHYTVVDALQSGDEICSSTRIRSLLAIGKMQEAAALLTRPYSITGIVQHGAKRGREWGFPTANIHLRRMFYPAYGIYAGRLTPLESGIWNLESRKYDAVMNLGIRPMYPLQTPLLEVHLLDASPDLYGKKVRVELLHYLRPEAKFESEDELRVQIAQDCADARAILAAADAPKATLPESY